MKEWERIRFVATSVGFYYSLNHVIKKEFVLFYMFFNYKPFESPIKKANWKSGSQTVLKIEILTLCPIQFVIYYNSVR